MVSSLRWLVPKWGKMSSKECIILRLEHKFVWIEGEIVSSRCFKQGDDCCVMGSFFVAMAKNIVSDSNAVGDTSQRSVDSFLKPSPATLSPNGRHSQRYLPQGVLKVVSKLLSLSRGTCQYPDFTSSTLSSTLKYLESASSDRMSSIVLLYH